MNKRINKCWQSLLLVTIETVIMLQASSTTFGQKSLNDKYPKQDFSAMSNIERGFGSGDVEVSGGLTTRAQRREDVRPGAPRLDPYIYLLDVSNSVAKGQSRFYEVTMPRNGTLIVQLTGSNDARISDADLYVKSGEAPTLSSYGCRPYKTGSNENCFFTSSASVRFYIMVNGHSTASSYRLVVKLKKSSLKPRTIFSR